MSRHIVFDTETTGLSPNQGHRITEIGCIEVIDFLPTDQSFHCFINPERDVPEEVQKITGLTTAFLKDKPLFKEIAQGFLDFVGESPLVAHNASFDRNFLNAELTLLGHTVFPEERFIDTLDLARKKFPGSYNSLDALCKRFDISLETRERHGALIDARLLAEVYLELHGGRERSLDIFKTGHIPTQRGDQHTKETIPPRQTSLPPLLTQEERTAHKVFLEQLGEKALWGRYDV